MFFFFFFIHVNVWNNTEGIVLMPRCCQKDGGYCKPRGQFAERNAQTKNAMLLVLYYHSSTFSGKWINNKMLKLTKLILEKLVLLFQFYSFIYVKHDLI